MIKNFKVILTVFTFSVFSFLSNNAQAANFYTQAPLPYTYNAFDGIIDAETMELHYSKHHAAYIANLEKFADENQEIKKFTLEGLLKNISKFPAGVRNNAGGHWNHTFFWQIMAPRGHGGEISEPLQKKIEETFGSFDEFKEKFVAAGMAQFGSGWVWLVVQGNGKLVITTTANQDNPLMNDVAVRGVPILANDLWEHAYYLQYQNRRKDYLEIWFNIINWNKVNELYTKAITEPTN